MYGFKKRQKRNFRKKIDETNDINVSVEEPEDGPPSSSLPRSVHKHFGKSKVNGTKAKSVVSFADDEEEGSEVFQVKKSAESRRLVRQVVKEKKKREKMKSEVNTQISVAGEYTAEKIAALKAESFGERMSATEIDLVRSRSGDIPDAATIHAARKKRELARQLGADFLPLDDTQRLSSRETRSRLVREDDNDVSDEEPGDSTQMKFSSVKPSEVMRKKELAMKDALNEDECEDEELKRWEQEQIKKGVTTQQLALFQSQEQAYASGFHLYAQTEQIDYSTNTPPYSRFPYGVATTTPMPMTVPFVTEDTVVDINDIITRLQTNVSCLKEVNCQHHMQAGRHGEDGRIAEENAGQLEKRSADVAWKYTFYQDMRGYVRDLLACLHEKVKVISQVETLYHELLKKRSERLVERRRQDVTDQSLQFDSSNMSSGVDEFGRDRSSNRQTLRQRRLVDRDARSRRRRDKRERERDNSIKEAEHHDGMSTDDEETESAIQWFKGETGKVMQQAAEVFEDVRNEFSSLEIIKERFEKWKFTHPASYSQAYMGLCLPKLFTPFVRLQMLDWHPVESDEKDFEQMEWFETLTLFGYDAESCEIHKDDDDINIVPRVVEKALVPKLAYLLDHVWDPMSRQQSKRVFKFVKKLTDEYPTIAKDSKPMQDLLKIVIGRLRNAVESDVFLPLYPKSLVENKASGAFAFVERQFWSCVKLLGNISLWHGLVPDSTLYDLCCDSLLNRSLVLSLQHTVCKHADVIYKCERTVSALPSQWFEGMMGNKTIKSLETFCWFLGKLAVDVKKAEENGGDSGRKKTKELLRQIAVLLSYLHAVESAEKLVEKYRLTPIGRM